MFIDLNTVEKIIKNQDLSLELNPNDIFPIGWNHLKKEWVAKLGNIGYSFISELSDFTRSRANASLSVSMASIAEKDIVCVHDGSHKHMTISYYIFKESKFFFLFKLEGNEIVAAASDSIKTKLEAEIEKIERKISRKMKMEKVMKMAWALKKSNKDYIFSECLKMAWEYVNKCYSKFALLSKIIGTPVPYWNGKVYRNNTVYVNDTPYRLTEDQVKNLA